MSNAMNSVSPKASHKCIVAATRARRSIFVWGAPGIGKSDVVRQVADAMSRRDAEGNVIKECEVYDVRLLLLDPCDLRGVPYRNPDTNKMLWSEPSILPPEFLPNPNWKDDAAETVDRWSKNMDYCILFLDELTAAPPSVQAAAYQLVLDRKIGDYNLPENCMVVAAGNRQSDRGVVYKMPTPLSNRFIHIEMNVNPKEWLEWAITNSIHPDVIGFISEKQAYLHDFDPTKAEAMRAFATPRSWEFVSDMCHDRVKFGTDSETFDTLVYGSVGEGTGIEFVNWLRSAKDLPKASDILSGKVKTMKNKNISAQYYIVSSLCYETNEAFKKMKEDQKKGTSGAKAKDKFDELSKNMTEFVISQLNQELQIMAIRTMVSIYKIVFNVKKQDGLRTFLEKNKRVIIDAVGSPIN